MNVQSLNHMERILGPYQRSKIVRCSADASPNSQRERIGPAGYFFPGGRWVGTIRNCAETLGCRFVVLTTAHGMVNPDDLIEPYDVHIDYYPKEVTAKWYQTIPNLLGKKQYELMVFYSGGCPRDPYLMFLKPILHSLGISLATFGKPNMFDVGLTTELVGLLITGTTFQNIISILKCPERFEFHLDYRKAPGG